MEELSEHLLNSATGHCWEKIGVFPHHGIALPLFSLHSENSCGIGEFYDLCPLIDWCQKLKLDLIQLLPLNNSENDPSPYNACSSLALNPLNLSLDKLPHVEEFPELKEQLKTYLSIPLPPRIDFSDVKTFKTTWLNAYFDAAGKKLIESKPLEQFISENPWVETYALYESLKSALGRTSWTTWPPKLKTPTEEEYAALIREHWPMIAYHITLQYLCYLQLKHVKTYAQERGVFLMGDIPILLSKESADVWENPELFDINWEAGAPPDMYNTEGQCWGFPLYRWDVMRKTQYAWWKQRLEYASNFYDLYRLDHVIGFFRIWAVPPGLTGKEGCFFPKEESLWEPQGREILEALTHATEMLPIAEDLGVVPTIVRPILQEMGICGTKVMRWERIWDEEGRFIPLQYYPPISLTCLSTHDSETLELWWTTYPEEAKAFTQYKHWKYTPTLTAAQRKEILWDSHHTSSLFHVNLLQEYLALFDELIFANPEEERINTPGKLLATNWTYRFRPTVEEITAHEELAKMIQKIVFSPDSLSL